MSPEGLITGQSLYGPKETLDRLVSAIAGQGMTLLARIDHAAAAAAVGITLRPTEVVIFGNPKAGTSLMLAAQTIGIDLPLKALVWEDSSNATWLSYSEPAWLAARHGVGSQATTTLISMAEGLAKIANYARGESA